MQFSVANNDSHDPPEVRVALKRLDLEEMVKSLGVEVFDRNGEWLNGKCPFHEGGGGWAILVEGQARGWNRCFVCGGNGLIAVIAQQKNLSRDEAISWFMGEHGLDHDDYPTAEELATRLAKTTSMVEANTEIYLPQSVGDHVAIDWHLQHVRGYSPAEIPAVKRRFSILWCSAGYYREAVVIPFVERGNLFGFSAEAVSRDLVLPGTKNTKHPEGRRRVFPLGFKSERHIYGYDHAVEVAGRIGADWVVVVEGQWDAIRWLQWDIPTVSIFGARLSAYHVARLARRFAKVVFCFDLDLNKPIEKRQQHKFEAQAAREIGSIMDYGFARLPLDPSRYIDGKGDPGGACDVSVVREGLAPVVWQRNL
jgi:hypothetical protein